MLRVVVPVLLLLLLDGCAAVKDSGRAQLVVPSEVGAVYSEVELQAQLALRSKVGCWQPDCEGGQAFPARVARLAARLEAPAAALAESLGADPPHFSVSVADTSDVGTLSSASGRIVVFAGVRSLALSDPALAFLIAREMGHVVGRHHEENTASGIAVSVAVAILFPITGLLQGMEAAYRTTSVATTATSFAGSRMVQSLYEEDQRREADGYAMQMLIHAGWAPGDVARGLAAAAAHLDDDGWLAELRDSACWLNAIVSGPHPGDASPAMLPAEYFGPVLAPDMRWVARLLRESLRKENVCTLPLPAERAGTTLWPG